MTSPHERTWLLATCAALTALTGTARAQRVVAETFGTQGMARYGAALADIADIDGDGVRDLVIGEPNYDYAPGSGVVDSGAVVLRSSRTGIVRARSLGLQAFGWFGTSVAVNSSLEHSLTHLVKIRASQINGCANCINMHTAEARAQGESEQRIYLLSAWREAPCYTDRERAALGWTEALTRLSEGHAHAAAYEALKGEFTEEEQVKLTLMINVINGWNRLAVGFGLFVDPEAAKSIQAKVAA